MSETVYWCDLALVDGVVGEHVAITIAEGRFSAVQVGVVRPAAATRLPGLTIPGFANAHSHAFHRALRARTQAGNGSFWTWRELMYLAAERLDPDRYYRLARAAFAEMALAGIAVVGEFHYLHHQPDGTPYANPNAVADALLAAAAEAGIRITLLDTLYVRGGLHRDGYTGPEGVQHRFIDSTADHWAERVDQLTPTATSRIGAAIHSVRAVDPASLRVAVEWARRHDAPLHAHVSEQPAENDQCVAFHGITPTQLLGDAGALGPRFSAVHATHITDDDLTALANTGSVVCVCPTTERDLGDGIGPTAVLAQAKVMMTLGTDSHAIIDMFEEARAIELNERLRAQRRGIHSATHLLAMATANGHASLGWSDAGEIATGNRADLVTISLESVRTAGASAGSAMETAVFAATAADITHVVIDGVRVGEGGRHRTIDVTRELHTSITELLDL